MMNKNSYWVYILYCDNDSLYTGYTNNLEKRFKQHLNGTGRCKYTQAFKPVSIAQSWDVGKSKSVAMKIEFLIKKLSKSEKQNLINNPNSFQERFSALLLRKYDSVTINEGFSQGFSFMLFSDFDDDVIQAIFGFLLMPAQVFRLRSVCKHWRDLIDGLLNKTPFLLLDTSLLAIQGRRVAMGMAPVNSSGDIYHMLAFVILSVHRGAQIAPILLRVPARFVRKCNTRNYLINFLSKKYSPYSKILSQEIGLICGNIVKQIGAIS